MVALKPFVSKVYLLRRKKVQTLKANSYYQSVDNKSMCGQNQKVQYGFVLA